MTKSGYNLANLPRVLIPNVVWHQLVSDVHIGLDINGINPCSCGCDGIPGTVATILIILLLFGAHYFGWSKENRLGNTLGRSRGTFCKLGLPVNSLCLALHLTLSSISIPPSKGKNLTSPFQECRLGEFTLPWGFTVNTYLVPIIWQEQYLEPGDYW